MKSSKFFVSTLIAAAAMTATAWADHTFSADETLTVSQNTTHDSVSVDSGVTGIFDFGGSNNVDLQIRNLSLTGNLVVNENVCDLAEFGNISGTGSITLSKTTANNWGGALVLSGDSSGYTGTINIWNGRNAENNPGQYSQFLVLKSVNAAGSATINLGAATVLAVSAGSETNIGGLNSQNSAATVVSRAYSFAYEASDDNPYRVSYSGSNPTNDGTHRTLSITGAGTYEYKGVFGSSSNIRSLSLDWSGSGSQTLSGTNYIGDLAVSGGTLALTGITTIAGSVTNSANLTLGGSVSLSSAITNTGTIALNEGLSLDLSDFAFRDGENAIISSGGTISGTISAENITGVAVARGGLFQLKSDASILSISLSTGTVTWAGTSVSNTWNTSEDNQVWNLSEGGNTSFYAYDNVVFDNTAATKTVLLSGGTHLTVGTAEVKSGDYTWAVSDNNKATISGNTLTIANGASLRVGDQGNNTAKQVSLDFDSISVAGTLNFNTSQANTWSSLTLEEGGTLHFIDGTANVVNLSVDNLIISGSANITAQWDKKLVVGVLSGAGDLTITGMTTTDAWSGRMTIALNDLSDYTGAMTLNNGSGNGLTVTASDSSKLAGKTIAIGESVQFNVTSTADPNTTTDLSGITGMGTLSFDLKNDNGAGFNLSGFTGTVEVGSGRFQMNTSAFNDAAKIKIISGGDLVFNDSTETDVSNAVTFAAGSTIHVNNGKRGMLSGTIDAQDQTITKAGSGILTLSGEATIGTLSQTAGTLTLSGEATIGTLGQTGGTLEVSGNVSATRYVGTQNGGTAGTFSIANTGVLTITGNVDDVTGNASSFLLSNWGAKTTMNVAGVLNLQNVGLNNRDGTAEISVNDGGEFNFGKGLTINENGGNPGAVILNLNEGGRLNIGASGIKSENYLTLNLRGGTIGSLADSWSSDRSMGLGGAIVVDTTKMSMNTLGKATSSGTGSTITLSGALSGVGAIVKEGAGTLTLSGNNTYTGGTTINEGTLVAASEKALGDGNVTVESGAKSRSGRRLLP